MKKASLLLLLLLAVFIPSKAQEPVTLAFTANAQGGMYCSFDAVNVTNVTRGWTETLAYPDTILVLNPTVGLDEQHGTSFHLGEAYPNPFTNETNALLEMSFTSVVFIQVIRIDGVVVATSQINLEAGSHRVKVSLSSPTIAFLVVTSTQGRQVVRMMCTGTGGRDSITVEPVSRMHKPSIQLMRGDATGEFQPGDMMRYTAVLFDGANTVYSNTITQQQYESQVVTLHFDLTLPEVTTNQVIDITQTTATGGGNVTATGGVSMIERGICWSTSHNPTTSGNHASNGTGTGTYSVLMNGLSAGTTYYVRAYAVNSLGTAYGNEVSFTTMQIPSYTISVSANPTSGGTVTGGGSYQQGQSCTVIAMAANGYSFTNWTENGGVVSTNPNYSFTVNNSRSLVANFSVQAPNTYYINASPNPSNGGVVTGGGTYQQGQSCTVTATPNMGYTFLRWTENGNQVSTNASYTFTVTSNRTLVAQFQIQSYTIDVSASPNTGGNVTGGGSFNYGQSCTVTAIANTGYTFLQWTENGTQVSTNANYTFTVTGNRALIAQFQLQSYTINTSANPTNGGSVTGGGSYNYGQSCTVTATASTGYTFLRWTENGNQISTNASYTFTVTGNRTLVAQFQAQGYTINVSANPTNGGTASGGGSYNYGQSCTVTATANTGYTFLRWTENGTQVSTNANYTFTVTSNRTLVAQFQSNATIPTVTTAQVTNITPTTAVGGGNVTSSGGATVTERGICWSTGHNPTTNSSHTNSGTGTGSFTVGMTGLTANTIYYVRAYAINNVGTAYGNEVSFTTLNNSSNHEHVDLGLPSGTLWATCNVGANTPEDYGNHFAWGETQPKGEYSWNTYLYCNGSSNTLTKYCNNSNYGYNGFTDNLTTLLPEDDAATANWGNDWRMPTKEEWDELWDNTTHTWTIQNGVNGTLFIASNGNSLFLPAAGYCTTSSSPYSAGTYGYYWSSSLYTSNPSKAWTCYFSSYGCNVYYDFYRDDGQSVRAVRSMQPGNTYSITVSASPAYGGTVSGGGTYQQGQSCTVSATAASGYAFTNWTENGSVVSTNANYTFTVNSNRTLVAHFSAQAPNTYTISVSSNPTNGGWVTGGGTYQQGQSCTVSASANTGYTFLRWTENGTQVSTNASYTFTVTGNRTLVAQFQAQGYTINVSANPTNGGSVTGGGSYNYGQSCTVTATAASGYTFLRWTENGNQVSSNANYTFTVTGNRTLVAQFQTNATIPTVTTSQVTSITQTTAMGGGNVTNSGGSTVSERGICWSTSHNPTTSGSHAGSGTGTGSFTVGMTGLTANTTYYVRAYAINNVGTAYGNEVSFTTLNNSSNHEHVDLGLPSGTLWATCNVGANTPEDYGNHFAWGETYSKGEYSWNTYLYCNGSSNTLTKYCNNSYYGYNVFTDSLTTLLPEDDAATANWGNDWRMPTREEWLELYNNTTFTWMTQNGVNGQLFTSSNGNSLFLPAAGYSGGYSILDLGVRGHYWSSSLYTGNPGEAWELLINSSGCHMYVWARFCGKSVRAVRSSGQTNLCSVLVISSSATGGTVTIGGTYQQGQSCTVSATANSGYSFTNWTENGNVVSTNAIYTFTVTGNRSLVANFTYGDDNHEYVDLGLPSGLLWATCNVGADAPEGYGDYFAWGEIATKDYYHWINYQYCNGDIHQLTKYCNQSFYGYNGFTDNLTTLEPGDDVATSNWGGIWRMPTNAEWHELYNNTTKTMTIQNGVYGMRFTAANGNSIFLPAAGYIIYSSLYYNNHRGGYWSSSLSTAEPCDAWYLDFYKSGGTTYIHTGEDFRCIGHSVRPVRSASQN